MDDIIFVTAFKDIGRSTWNNYSRSTDTYITLFMILAQNIKYKLIVFAELQMINELKQKKIPDNIIIYDILTVNTFLNKYLETEKKIMEDQIYKQKIPAHRKINPEHIYPEYTLINHSKINFISRVKKLFPNYTYYSWIDFGAIRQVKDVPMNINFNLLEKKIIYHALYLPQNRTDVNDMLASDMVYITGSQFVIHYDLIDIFEKTYENKINELHQKNVCDDDQSLILQLYYDNPNMFNLFVDRECFSLFRKYLNS